jgi:hypothetical protein
MPQVKDYRGRIVGGAAGASRDIPVGRPLRISGTETNARASRGSMSLKRFGECIDAGIANAKHPTYFQASMSADG